MKTAEEFLNDLRKTPAVPFIIDQLLPDSRQAFSINCGRPEIGKTNLSLYEAFCIATGTPFLSFKTQKKRVGYIFMEGGPRQIGERIQKLSCHFGGMPPYLHIEHLEPTVLTQKGVEKLDEIICDLEVVFFDSLKFLIPGDYMKPANALKGLNNLLELQNRASFTSILVGHIRKPDRRAISYPEDYWSELKGPGEYMELANSALMLTRPAHTQDSRGYFTSNPNARILYFIKARDATKELNPLRLQFNREKLLYLPIEERREKEDDHY